MSRVHQIRTVEVMSDELSTTGSILTSNRSKLTDTYCMLICVATHLVFSCIAATAEGGLWLSLCLSLSVSQANTHLIFHSFASCFVYSLFPQLHQQSRRA